MASKLVVLAIGVAIGLIIAMILYVLFNDDG